MDTAYGFPPRRPRETSKCSLIPLNSAERPCLYIHGGVWQTILRVQQYIPVRLKRGGRVHVAEKARGGYAVAVIKFLFRFYAICVQPRGGEGRTGRNLMMMYRGRATERRGNSRAGGCPLAALPTLPPATKEELKYKEREKRDVAVYSRRRNTRYDCRIFQPHRAQRPLSDRRRQRLRDYPLDSPRDAQAWFLQSRAKRFEHFLLLPEKFVTRPVVPSDVSLSRLKRKILQFFEHHYCNDLTSNLGWINMY